MSTSTLTKCPRCEAALVGTALSRNTRDDGAEVFICNRCGQRESLYGYGTEEQIPLSDWPVSVSTLLTEEAALIQAFRESTILSIPTDEIEGPA